MLARSLAPLAILAPLWSSSSYATPPQRNAGSERLGLEVFAPSALLARRLPGNTGNVQVLFERVTDQGTVGLMRVQLERGTASLDELLRPDMEPELLYVLHGAAELELDSNTKPSLSPGDVVYRANRKSRVHLTGKSRQPLELLLWSFVAPPSRPIGAVPPIVRPLRRSVQNRLRGAKGSTKVLVDRRIAPEAVASLELLHFSKGGGMPEQAHRSAEILVVVRGSGALTLGGRDVALAPGHAVYLPPSTTHSLRATSKDGLIALRSYVPPGPEASSRVGRQP